MTDSRPEPTFVPRRPTLAEHRSLAESVGWLDHFDWRTLPDSLTGSLHGVVTVVDGTVVGMARLVGDGSHYFYIQDVIVHPEHHDSGFASTMVEHLLEWIASEVSSRAFVGLFASDEAIGVYESLGFTTRDMTGMHRFIEPRATDGE